MALFSVEIADADVPRVLNAVAANFGYEVNVPNPNFDPEQPVDEINAEFIPNPISLPVFANQKVREFLADHVKQYEIREAKKAALAAVNGQVQINDPQI